MDSPFGRYWARLVHNSNHDVFNAYEPAGLEEQSAQPLTYCWEPRCEDDRASCLLTIVCNSSRRARKRDSEIDGEVGGRGVLVQQLMADAVVELDFLNHSCVLANDRLRRILFVVRVDDVVESVLLHQQRESFIIQLS